jgi:hypothetical protein
MEDAVVLNVFEGGASKRVTYETTTPVPSRFLKCNFKVFF